MAGRQPSANARVLIRRTRLIPLRYSAPDSMVPAGDAPTQPLANSQAKPGAVQQKYTFQQKAFLAGGGKLSHVTDADHIDEEEDVHSATVHTTVPQRANDPLGPGLHSESLIEEVKQYRCLYQKYDAQYKNVKYKEKRWEEIAKKLNSTTAECKRRWKSLRDKYAREKRLDFQSLEYKKPWQHFSALEFLDDSMEEPLLVQNASSDNSTFDITEMLADDDGAQISQPAPKKTKKPDQPDEILELIKAKMELLERKMAEPADENESFLELIRVKMNKLSAQKKLEFQSLCLDLINNCLINDDKY